MISVESLRTEIQRDLVDAAAVTWSVADIDTAIYNAELACVMVRPDAAAVTVPFACAAGCRQALDSALYQRLLDVVQNVGGGTVRRVDQETLDQFNTAWMQATPAAATKEYVMDDRIPHEFYVNPPVVAGTQLLVKAARRPVPYATQGSAPNLTVDDGFKPAIKAWALYELMCKDEEDSPALALAAAQQQTFYTLLGVAAPADAQVSPKNRRHRR